MFAVPQTYILLFYHIIVALKNQSVSSEMKPRVASYMEFLWALWPELTQCSPPVPACVIAYALQLAG